MYLNRNLTFNKFNINIISFVNFSGPMQYAIDYYYFFTLLKNKEYCFSPSNGSF